MKRTFLISAAILTAISSLAGSPAAAQQVTLIAGGDIEWSRAVKPTEIYMDRERGKEGDWLPVPYIADSASAAYLGSIGAPVNTGRGHAVTSIQYGLKFSSKEEEARYPLLKVAPTMRAADIAFANLETPLSDRARHTGAFRTPTSFADGLKWAGIDVVSVANNHAMDAEEQGMMDTWAALDRVGIGHMGSGRDLEDARKPVIVEKNGLRFAFLGYSQLLNGGTSGYVLHDRSGVMPMNPILIKEDIRRVRDKVDYVIVSFHWSIENSQDTHPEDQSFAKAVVDAGADIVLGHHPHVPRGIEVYKGKPIVYSLGNLIFGHGHDYWVDNYLARFTFDGKNGIKQVEVLPTAGTGAELSQPFLVEGERAARSLQDIQARTAKLNTKMDIEGNVGIIRIGS